LHSRIFQLEKECLPEEEYISSDTIPDWFTDEIADYVSDDVDRDNDIEWLMAGAIGGCCSREGNKIIFSDTRKYFEGKYEDFVNAAKELSGCTLDAFISGHKIWSNLYSLKRAFNNKVGFYVYSESNNGYGELDTLDNFMRVVKPGDVYYIGGIVDYHC